MARFGKNMSEQTMLQMESPQKPLPLKECDAMELEPISLYSTTPKSTYNRTVRKLLACTINVRQVRQLSASRWQYVRWLWRCVSDSVVRAMLSCTACMSQHDCCDAVSHRCYSRCSVYQSLSSSLTHCRSAPHTAMRYVVYWSKISWIV